MMTKKKTLSFARSYVYEHQTCVICSLMWIIALVWENACCVRGGAGRGRPRPRSTAPAGTSALGLAKSSTSSQHHISAGLQPRQIQFISSWRGRIGGEITLKTTMFSFEITPQGTDEEHLFFWNLSILLARWEDDNSPLARGLWVKPLSHVSGFLRRRPARR